MMYVCGSLSACVLLLLPIISAKVPASVEQCFAAKVTTGSNPLIYSLQCSNWITGAGGASSLQSNVFTAFSNILFTWSSSPPPEVQLLTFAQCGGQLPGNCVINASDAVLATVVSKCLNKYKVNTGHHQFSFLWKFCCKHLKNLLHKHHASPFETILASNVSQFFFCRRLISYMICFISYMNALSALYWSRIYCFPHHSARDAVPVL